MTKMKSGMIKMKSGMGLAPAGAYRESSRGREDAWKNIVASQDNLVTVRGVLIGVYCQG